MKILLVSFILFSIIFTSCRKETKYMELWIKNDSHNELTVELFPKNEYVINYNLYRSSDHKNSLRSLRRFKVLTKRDEALFSSVNLDQMPYDLIDKIFDSIFLNINETTLKFSREKVIGYSENLFTDDSNWEYEVRYHDHIGWNSAESHVFSFVITEAKLKQ